MKSLLFFMGICCISLVDGKRRHVTATGRVLCSISGTSYPVEFTTVRLRGRDVLFHDTFGSTRTNSQGYFRVSGSAWDLFGNPDPFIEVEYEYSGIYGRMEVQRELFGINRREDTSTRRYSSHIKFGDIKFGGDHCKAYVMTYRAIKDYRSRTAKSLPYDRLKVVTRAPIHGGTPYSTINKIRVPKGYDYDFSTAKHELAHTVRHSLDGNFGHFLVDVVRYGYMRHHSCGSRTNGGFAFNEGWAEFWAGECFGTYGNSSTDYNYEGNVAKALRALKSRCRTSDGGMVMVLERKKRSIHSYNEFAAAHRNLYRCS